MPKRPTRSLLLPVFSSNTSFCLLHAVDPFQVVDGISSNCNALILTLVTPRTLKSTATQVTTILRCRRCFGVQTPVDARALQIDSAIETGGWTAHKSWEMTDCRWRYHPPIAPLVAAAVNPDGWTHRVFDLHSTKFSRSLQTSIFSCKNFLPFPSPPL